MAESILKIHTQNGDVPVGYPGLADKPISDKTLSKEGAFADSKAVGDKFKEAKTETDSLKEDLVNLEDLQKLISFSSSDEYKINEDGSVSADSTYIIDKYNIQNIAKLFISSTDECNILLLKKIHQQVKLEIL